MARPPVWMVLFLVGTGCTGRTTGGSEGAEDGSDSQGSATEASGAESGSQSDSRGSDSTTTTGPGSGAEVDTAAVDSSGGSPTTGGSGVCSGPETTYEVRVEVLDTGMGISGAPATIRNCTDRVAYVRNDCCYGPTFFLERRDSQDDPWMMATPGTACDCMGFVDPVEIDPGAEIEIPTNPPSYDSVPLCEVGIAYYRWTFFVGPEPDNDATFEALTTEEFSWYCEG